MANEATKPDIKIKNYPNLARNNGYIVNTNRDDYQNRLNAIKKQKELEEMKENIKEMQEKYDEVQKLMRRQEEAFRELVELIREKDKASY